MSDSVAPAGLVLRGDELAQMQRSIAATRDLERERRIRRLVSVGGGWAVAGMMTAVAVACLGVMWVRPVPQDRFYVSVLHDDGTYDPPQVRDDLSKSRREMLFRHTVTQYILSRENYSWEGENANYRKVSAMSSPAERERYQAMMLDKRNPENPAALYGDGLSAGIADVTAIQVKQDPASPNAVDAVFLVKITAPNQTAKTIRKTARMTWEPADGLIPAEMQQMYDPAGIAFTHYSSTPDPDAAR